MATNNFKRMSKMQTTEPTADEAGPGMKKGGKAKKMAMGGLPIAGPAGRRPMMVRPPAATPALLQRKEGGKAEENKEEREIKSVKKDLKTHESEKASVAHRGLKTGGIAKGKPAGYKDGGHVTMACKNEGGFTHMKKMAK